MRHHLLVLGLLAGLAAPLTAQHPTGRITGRVVSTQTDEPLPSVQVFLGGGRPGTLTDLDGRYLLLRIPAGTHEVVVQLIGYSKKTVTGVQVRPGATTVLDIGVDPQAVALEEITVSAKRERGSTAALLSMRQRSATVVDAIGAEQMRSSPDGDAAAALQRVPGVSVVDGKYVYVRGLGDRYGATTLNGAPMPSPEPDKKVVPLDLIPSSLLESIVTAKTYSPDQPGDYAGGLVQINTRRLTNLDIFKVGLGLGWNSRSSLRSGLGYPGGSYDWLGFDDGTRQLPAGVPADRPVFAGVTLSTEEVAELGRAFSGGAWGPGSSGIPLDQSVSLVFGSEVELFGRPLSFLGSATHNTSWTHKDDLVERVFASGGSADPEVDYSGLVTNQSVQSGALLDVSYGLGRTDRLSFSALFNRLVDDEARVLQGYNIDSNTDQRNTRIRYLSRAIVSTKLEGAHEPALLGGASLAWRLGASMAGREEPNTREVLYRRGPQGQFLWDNFIQSGSVFHSEMEDAVLSAAVDLKAPFSLRGLPASLALGGSADTRTRENYVRRFRFVPMGVIADSVRALAPDELFAPEHIGPHAFQLQEATFRADNYDAEQEVAAVYAMMDAEVLPRLRLVGGARIERAVQEVSPRDLFQADLDPLTPARLDDTDVLPGVNLTYELRNGMNLRAAASQTLARPQFRELAPFAFADYAGGHLVVGNPGLQRSRIRNYDLRWEWFFRPGALVTTSAFYKRFDRPIEVLVLPSSELLKTWVNAGSATNEGLELEARAPLGILADALDSFALNLNLTLVRSDVEAGGTARIYTAATGLTEIAVVDVDRPLQGQSPYVINAGLSYGNAALGTAATVLFNRFGRRIDAVGSQVLPDVYEEGRSELDVVVEQRLPRGFTAKLSASRLLGASVEFTQGGDTLRSWDAGRSVSLSIGWGGDAR